MAEPVRHFVFNLKWLFLFLIISPGINAQQPDDEIDIFNFNLKLLEQLTKLEIDSIRNEYNLQSLSSDSLCYLAALDQAYYLMDAVEFEHFQKNIPEKETPQKRIQFYGGKNYLVGENIAKIFINRISAYKKGISDIQSIYISTYKDAADLLAYAWANSPEHFVNIVSRKYSHSGLAALFNEEDNSLICVQVFASLKQAEDLSKKSNLVFDNYFFYSIQESLVEKDFANKFNRKENWNVRYSAVFKRITNGNSIIKSFPGISIITNENKVYINPGSIENRDILLNENIDGFALEIIPLLKYDCSANAYYSYPSRKYNSYIKKSTATKPAYMKEILRKSHANYTGDLNIYLGTLPDYLNFPYEMNIFILKGNYVIEIIPVNHLCREFIDLISEMPELNPFLKRNSVAPQIETDSSVADKYELITHIQFVQNNYNELTKNPNLLSPSLNYIYNHYISDSLSMARRVLLARYFIHFNYYNYAETILKPALDAEFKNIEAYKLYLAMYYSGKLYNVGEKDFYSKVIEAANYLTDEEWLGLFSGPCRLNNQLLDYEPLWFLYCSKMRVVKGMD